jgi:hypothetical protein
MNLFSLENSLLAGSTRIWSLLSTRCGEHKEPACAMILPTQHRPNGNQHSLAYPTQISTRITIDASFSIILSVKFKLAEYFARQRQPLRSGFEYRKNPTTPAPSRHPRHNGRSHPAGERIGPLIVSETQTSQLWDRLCPKFLSLQVRRPVRGKRSS